MTFWTLHHHVIGMALYGSVVGFGMFMLRGSLARKKKQKR